MKFREYGAGNADSIVLLHGGGLSWWNYRRAAELLQDEYHVVLPVLDGHAGSGRPFTSIAANAADIIAFIDEHLGGSVLLLGGLSLGGQIALEILSMRSGICSCAVVESACAIPSPLTRALIAPVFGLSFGLTKNRRFAQMQAASLHIPQELFEDYYRDTCLIQKADMIAFLKESAAYSPRGALRSCSADVHVVVGEKESKKMLQSAAALHAMLPAGTMTVMPGLHHGELSISNAARYADMLKHIAAAGLQHKPSRLHQKTCFT